MSDSTNQCEYCMYYEYDEDLDEYACTIEMDMDDIEKMTYDSKTTCPNFRMGDDYTIVRKQM